MGLILLEAFGALVVLVVIVWWTMFAGRRRGEIADPPLADEAPAPVATPAPKPPETPLSRD